MLQGGICALLALADSRSGRVARVGMVSVVEDEALGALPGAAAGGQSLSCSISVPGGISVRGKKSLAITVPPALAGRGFLAGWRPIEARLD